jgi:hypothetical protein
MKTLAALYAINMLHSTNLIISKTAYNETKRERNLTRCEM